MQEAVEDDAKKKKEREIVNSRSCKESVHASKEIEEQMKKDNRTYGRKTSDMKNIYGVVR